MAETEGTPSATDYRLNVGWKIKGVRELLNISQEYLAGELGIGQSSLSKIENGELIQFERLCDISRILNVNINMILNFNKDVIFNSCHQSGLHNNYNYNGTEEMKRMYELLIAEKEERIRLLERMLPRE